MITYEERKYTISHAYTLLVNDSLSEDAKEELKEILLQTELYVYNKFQNREEYFINMNDQIIRLKNMLDNRIIPPKSLKELKAMESRSGLNYIINETEHKMNKKEERNKIKKNDEMGNEIKNQRIFKGNEMVEDVYNNGNKYQGFDMKNGNVEININSNKQLYNNFEYTKFDQHNSNMGDFRRNIENKRDVSYINLNPQKNTNIQRNKGFNNMNLNIQSNINQNTRSNINPNIQPNMNLNLNGIPSNVVNSRNIYQNNFRSNSKVPLNNQYNPKIYPNIYQNQIYSENVNIQNIHENIHINPDNLYNQSENVNTFLKNKYASSDNQNYNRNPSKYTNNYNKYGQINAQKRVYDPNENLKFKSTIIDNRILSEPNLSQYKNDEYFYNQRINEYNKSSHYYPFHDTSRPTYFNKNFSQYTNDNNIYNQNQYGYSESLNLNNSSSQIHQNPQSKYIYNYHKNSNFTHSNQNFIKSNSHLSYINNLKPNINPMNYNQNCCKYPDQNNFQSCSNIYKQISNINSENGDKFIKHRDHIRRIFHNQNNSDIQDRAIQNNLYSKEDDFNYNFEYNLIQNQEIKNRQPAVYNLNDNASNIKSTITNNKYQGYNIPYQNYSHINDYLLSVEQQNNFYSQQNNINNFDVKIKRESPEQNKRFKTYKNQSSKYSKQINQNVVQNLPPENDIQDDSTKTLKIENKKKLTIKENDSNNLGLSTSENSIEKENDCENQKNILKFSEIKEHLDNIEFKNITKTVKFLFTNKEQTNRTKKIEEFQEYLISFQRKFIIYSEKFSDKIEYQKYKLIRSLIEKEINFSKLNKIFLSDKILMEIKIFIEDRVKFLDSRVEYSKIDDNKVDLMHSKMIENAVFKFLEKKKFEDDFVFDFNVDK